MVGQAILALVSGLSSFTWAAGSISWLLLRIDWFLPGRAMSPLSFAKLVSRRSRPQLAKMSLLVDTQGWRCQLHEMAMFWLMVLLVAIGACFLWRYVTLNHEGGREAPIATGCPLWSAGFLQEVVRDGSGKGVGDHREVTVNRDMFSLPCSKLEGKHRMFANSLAWFNDNYFCMM